MFTPVLAQSLADPSIPGIRLGEILGSLISKTNLIFVRNMDQRVLSWSDRGQKLVSETIFGSQPFFNTIRKQKILTLIAACNGVLNRCQICSLCIPTTTQAAILQ